MLPLSLAILVTAIGEPLAGRPAGAKPTRDGLAPLQAGLAQAGSRFDLVLRPQEQGCRLLLSDAETDAPIDGAKVTTKQFGKAGAGPVDGAAVAGQYDGHYLAACPAAGSALVVEASAASGSDLFTFNTAPAAAPVPQKTKTDSIPWFAGIGLLVLLLANRFWRARRGRRLHQLVQSTPWWGRPLRRSGLLGFLILVCLASGDATAHGVDEAGLPIAPGSELSLGQEIQFALGLRTGRVTVASFNPPAMLPDAASRSSPSVPRLAVVERDGKKLVFVRLAPERFVAREVTLGWSEGSNVAIESGLMPGELAVTAGGAFLRNGGASR